MPLYFFDLKDGKRLVTRQVTSAATTRMLNCRGVRSPLLSQ
jgi:hypothetical protein